MITWGDVELNIVMTSSLDNMMDSVAFTMGA